MCVGGGGGGDINRSYSTKKKHSLAGPFDCDIPDKRVLFIRISQLAHARTHRSVLSNATLLDKRTLSSPSF